MLFSSSVTHLPTAWRLFEAGVQQMSRPLWRGFPKLKGAALYDC